MTKFERYVSVNIAFNLSAVADTLLTLAILEVCPALFQY
jgi:hypothetical protein